jgi:hypothetical protein
VKESDGSPLAIIAVKDEGAGAGIVRRSGNMKARLVQVTTSLLFSDARQRIDARGAMRRQHARRQGDRQRFTQALPNDGPATGAERDADAQFLRPLGDRARGEPTVQTNDTSRRTASRKRSFKRRIAL